MPSAKPLVEASLVGLVVAAGAGTVAVLDLPGPVGALSWGPAHGAFALAGFLLPAFAALHVHSLERVLGRVAPDGAVRRLAVVWLAGAALWAIGHLFQPSNVFALVAWAGTLVLVAAAVLQLRLVIGLAPRRSESVVDLAKDPLTKGDDACFAHVRFAHFMLPLALLLLAAAYTPGIDGLWQSRLRLAGMHLLLAGHILLSCYGLAHLWIPRLSGIPAIAGGAIKGELHTTLLALVLLLTGFLTGLRGFTIAGGAFAFFGAFTFMGVLGANIMKNKSKTQRVTPEFSYIPWTFTAVFWLISGVLLGIFLNVIPDLYASSRGALRFTHVHIALLGGAAQLLLALAWRIVPAARNVGPPAFDRGKWGYYALNLGLCALLAGRFQAATSTPLLLVGASLVLIGLAASFIILERHGRGRQVTP